MGNLVKLAGRGRALAGYGRLAVVLPILIGAALRLARLGAQDLWYDEAATAWMAGLPWGRLVQAVAGDVHPPLWYAIEKAAVCFLGNTPLSLRLPAALCSIAALALLPGLAGALGLDRRVGLAATWIMALSPFQIWYAQEGRMYALLLLAVEVGALGVFTRRWWLTVPGLAVALLSHNIGVVYVVILIGLDVVLNMRFVRTVLSLRHVPWIDAVAGAIYAPWAWVAMRQAAAVSQSFWVQRPVLGAIPLTLHDLFWGSMPPAWLGVFVVFLSGLATIAAAWAGVRGRRWALLALAFAPLLATWAISQWKPVLISRLMIGCTPFLCLLLGKAMVDHHRTRWLALAAAPVLLLVLGSYYSDPDVQKGDVGRFVEPVQAQWQDGDAVLHTCIPSYILLSYYAPDLDHYLWRQANDLSQALSDQTKRAMGMRETTIEELLQGHSRVWVYYSDSPVTSQAELDENKRIRSTYRVAWDRAWMLETTDLIESGVYLVER